MTKMMFAVIVGLVGSAVACGGAAAEDEGNAEENKVPSVTESNPPPVAGEQLKVQGLKPVIHDGVNGSCTGSVCGGGIKPSAGVWD